MTSFFLNMARKYNIFFRNMKVGHTVTIVTTKILFFWGGEGWWGDGVYGGPTKRWIRWCQVFSLGVLFFHLGFPGIFLSVPVSLSYSRGWGLRLFLSILSSSYLSVILSLSTINAFRSLSILSLTACLDVPLEGLQRCPLSSLFAKHGWLDCKELSMPTF